jgi:hypothetical protein
MPSHKLGAATYGHVEIKVKYLLFSTLRMQKIQWCNLPNVMVLWVALPLPIREVPGSNSAW